MTNMTNNANDRSYLYGRLETLLRRYEEEARKAAGIKGMTYIDTHISYMHAKPHTVTKRCLDYLNNRTNFAQMLKARKPETEAKLSGLIDEVMTTIDELYGDNDGALYYAATFGAERQESELQNA